MAITITLAKTITMSIIQNKVQYILYDDFRNLFTIF